MSHSKHEIAYLSSLATKMRPVFAINLCALLSTLVLATACVHKPNTKAIRKVKSAAIIGFTVVQPREQPLTGIDNTFKTGAKYYDMVAEQLQTAREWRMTPLKALQPHRDYHELSLKFGAHLLSNDLRPTGILSQEEQVNLSPKQRKSLQKALMVDGLVSVSFVITRRPPPPDDPDAPPLTAKISFDLYAGKNAKSVWHVASLPSDKADGSTLPDALSAADGDEKNVAIAISSALATVLKQRQLEEAEKK
jgi:hypothetical protein